MRSRPGNTLATMPVTRKRRLWAHAGRDAAHYADQVSRRCCRLGQERAKSHVYLADADVAFQSGAVIFASAANYPGEAAATIEGKGLMVMPGLVNIHAHPSSEPHEPKG